jgi:hypothetical protein
MNLIKLVGMNVTYFRFRNTESYHTFLQGATLRIKIKLITSFKLVVLRILKGKAYKVFRIFSNHLIAINKSKLIISHKLNRYN